jgi:beta-lactamase class C
MGGYPQVISSQMLDTLYQPLIVTPIKNRYFRLWQPFNKAYYGLGWRILQFPDHKVVYHGGYVNGYRSEIAFIPDEGLGIVVLVNAPSSLPNFSIPKFFEVFHKYESQILRWDQESVETNPEGSLSARKWE